MPGTIHIDIIHTINMILVLYYLRGTIVIRTKCCSSKKREIIYMLVFVSIIPQ